MSNKTQDGDKAIVAFTKRRDFEEEPVPGTAPEADAVPTAAPEIIALRGGGRIGSIDSNPQVRPPAPPPAPLPAAAKDLGHNEAARMDAGSMVVVSSETISLESIHAYLLLSDDWSTPRVEPEGMRYSRWRRAGAGELLVPLNRPSEGEDPVPGLIKDIVAIEGRRSADLETDLRRLRSMRTFRGGPYQDLKQGVKDTIFFNRMVESLILVTPTFVVFLDDSDEVFYAIDDAFGERPKDFGKVLSRLAALQAEPIKHLPASVRKSFRTLLGDGVARLLHDRSSENANAVFDKAESFLRARNNEAARLTYLGAAIPTTLLAIVADVFLWKYRVDLDAMFVNGFTVAAVAASMGAIGAFLSIFLRLTNVDIDVSAGRLLLVVECTLRVFVGVVVAAVVGWAVNANLLLGFTAGIAGASIGTKMLVGLLSGASERAMPTLMKKFDSSMSDGAPGSSASPPKVKPKADPEKASAEVPSVKSVSVVVVPPGQS